MKMNPKHIAIATASAVLGGAGVGFLVVGPMAHASSPAAVHAAATGASGVTAPGASRHQHLVDTLAPLVSNGTITQAQADSVISALEQARPAGGKGAGRGIGREARREGASVAAATIGITTTELRTELRSGKTIAEVATAHGVSPQKVIDAMVADAEARLDAAVTAGRITAAQAATMKTRIAAQIADRVNNGRPASATGNGSAGSTPSSTTTAPGA
jgi:hypothetical protein